MREYLTVFLVAAVVTYLLGVVAREVAAGRATAGDAQTLQQEAFDLMARVPGLQFVTNEPFGVPDQRS